MKKLYFLFTGLAMAHSLLGQNIGIGTDTPAERLDVIGNVRFSQALMPNGQAGTAGHVLISQGPDAAPVWQALSGGSGNNRNFAKMVRGIGTGFDTPSEAVYDLNGYILTLTLAAPATVIASFSGTLRDLTGPGTSGMVLISAFYGIQYKSSTNPAYSSLAMMNTTTIGNVGTNTLNSSAAGTPPNAIAPIQALGVLENLPAGSYTFKVVGGLRGISIPNGGTMPHIRLGSQLNTADPASAGILSVQVMYQ